MMDDVVIDRAIDVITVLAEPNRFKILAILTAEELSVGEVQRRLGVSQSLASNHLLVLHQAGLVRRRRVAQWNYYRLNHDGWDTAIRAINAVFNPEHARSDAPTGESRSVSELVGGESIRPSHQDAVTERPPQ
jgi:DNA-binding transcriptional ArsR family regulator